MKPKKKEKEKTEFEITANSRVIRSNNEICKVTPHWKQQQK